MFLNENRNKIINESIISTEKLLSPGILSNKLNTLSSDIVSPLNILSKGIISAIDNASRKDIKINGIIKYKKYFFSLPSNQKNFFKVKIIKLFY